MTISGIKEWDSSGFKNSSKTFIMDVNEHISGIKVEVVIRSRNVLE